MKFALKMMASTVILVCIVLSLSVYFMVETSFQTEIESEKEKAVSDTVMLCYGFETVANQPANLQKSLKDICEETNFLQSQSFRLFDENGTSVFSNLALKVLPMGDELPSQNDMMLWLFGEDGHYYIGTRAKLLHHDEVLQVERFQEITSVFQRKEENWKLYRILMATAIGAVMILSGVISFVLTSPLRTLSRTTRKIASGDYKSRIKFKSNDEIGDFIEDFNVMAGSMESKMEELEEAARRERDFTASFAHELKTPLTSIIGYADTLRSRELPPDKRFRAANYIFTEGKRLESMSRALMDLFITENKEIERKPAEAKKLLEEVRQSAAFSLAKKQIRFTVKADDFTLHVEPNLIKTLLLNTIDNARKATEEGGEILLTGEKIKEGYRLSVKDTGRGIPPEEISKITEAFYMVDKSRARAEGGAGIGLALCSKIAEAHGTRLQIESTLGVGTQVSLVLKEGEE